MKRMFLSIVFLICSITGIALFLYGNKGALINIHVFAGLFATILGLGHMFKYRKQIMNYFIKPDSKIGRVVRIVGVVVVIFVVIVGIIFDLPPFSYLLKEDGLLNSEKSIVRKKEVNALNGESDHQIVIDILVGENYESKEIVDFIPIKVVPQMAVWVEDMDGDYIETLYVTKKDAESSYYGVDGRNEALPVWRNKREISKKSIIVDGISSATTKSDLEIIRNVDRFPARFKVMLEVNKSFDFNEYYRENLSEKDAGYNTGFSGQPSIIYEVVYEKSNDGTYIDDLQKMKIIGHGSQTGADGLIDTDISHITTALKILDRVIVELQMK